LRFLGDVSAGTKLQRTRFLGLERTFFATLEGFAASSVFVFSRHSIPPVTLVTVTKTVRC
jgi:hypothetical protein